jgi:hypothetical protein
MGDNREIDRWKEISFEATSLFLTPGKACVMSQHEVMHKVSLCWPHKAARVVFVELILSLECVAVSGYEWQWVGIEYW